MAEFLYLQDENVHRFGVIGMRLYRSRSRFISHLCGEQTWPGSIKEFQGVKGIVRSVVSYRSKYNKICFRTDPKDLENVEYDYKTVFNISPQGADFCTTYREGMKKWNICIQYWLNVNVFKRFPYKKFRVLATVMTSAMWHGVYSGYYVCICTIPLALMVEDVWVKILHIETKHVVSFQINFLDNVQTC